MDKQQLELYLENISSSESRRRSTKKRRFDDIDILDNISNSKSETDKLVNSHIVNDIEKKDIGILG